MKKHQAQRADQPRFFVLALPVLLMAALSFSGCKEKNTPVDPGESEVITTVTITLISTDTHDTSVVVWEDIDGVGGNPPNRIDTMKVGLGKSYDGTIKVENRSVTPSVDLTAEIRTLGTQHQFFYVETAGLVKISATDVDARGLPIGLTFTLGPQSRGEGALTASLSHFEDATKKDGNTPSDETDIAVTFPLIVQ